MPEGYDTRRFLVQGSAPEPYVVEFFRRGSNLTAECTCPAGLLGQHCSIDFGSWPAMPVASWVTTRTRWTTSDHG